MELMEVVDPVAFDTWIRESFLIDTCPTDRRKRLALQHLMTNAVMDPQVTILSHAAAEAGVDEIQARMTIALMSGFLQTQINPRGEDHVES